MRLVGADVVETSIDLGVDSADEERRNAVDLGEVTAGRGEGLRGPRCMPRSPLRSASSEKMSVTLMLRPSAVIARIAGIPLGGSRGS